MILNPSILYLPYRYFPFGHSKMNEIASNSSLYFGKISSKDISSHSHFIASILSFNNIGSINNIFQFLLSNRIKSILSRHFKKNSIFSKLIIKMIINIKIINKLHSKFFTIIRINSPLTNINQQFNIILQNTIF